MSEPTVKATDNDSIPLVGRYAEGPTRAVDTQGEFAYFGTGEYLTVANISSPANPTEVGRVLLPSQARDIKVRADYAYVAAGLGGLAIIDVSEPTTPKIVNGFGTPSLLSGNEVTDVTVSGKYLYYTSGYGGLNIVNISDPDFPERVGVFKPGGDKESVYAHGVAVKGRHAYVTAGDVIYSDGGGGLKVVDISDPSDPQEVATFDSGSYMQGRSTELIIQEQRAFVSGGFDGLKVLDISEPTKPQQIGTFNPSGLEEVHGFDINEDYVYVRDRVVDVSDPADPKQVVSWDTDSRDVSVSESHAYATTGTGGLKVIDVSDPSDPENAGSFSANDFIHHIAFSGKYAYAATGNLVERNNGGLTVIDISDPKNPKRSAFLPIEGVIEEVVTDGKYVYIGNKIIDVSNPSKPEVISESISVYKGAYLKNDNLYTISGGKLIIKSVSDPHKPKRIGSINIEDGSSQTWGNVVVYGDFAYASEDDEEIDIIDISEPSNPSKVGTYSYEGSSIRDMVVSGGYLYFTDGLIGTYILDISSPKSPTQVSQIFPLNFNIMKGIDVSDGFIYIADGYGGLRVVDISDPSLPKFVGRSRSTFTSIENVKAKTGFYFSHSTYDYTFKQKGGLYIFDFIGVNNSSPPVISNISPDSLVGSRDRQSLVIEGEKFEPESSVKLQNKRTGETFPDLEIAEQTNRRLIIEHVFGVEAANWSVEVINPGADKSGEFRFEVLPAGTGQTPAPPTDLTASAQNGSINLNWNASTSEYIQESILYRSIDASRGSETLIDTLDGGATSYVDTTIEAGTQYRYRLRVRNAAGNMSPFSSGVSVFFKPSSLTYDLSRNFNGADETTDYRLVALPGQISQPFSEMVSGKAGVEWQAFWDNGSAENYLIKQDGSATFTFQPGRGFWMLKKSNWSVSQSVETVPVSGKESTSIPLHDGWNIISNPFGKDVSWAQVDAAHSESLRALWHFDGSFADADTFRSARTGEAFYFLNDTSLDSLNVPYVKDSVASKQAVRKSHEEDKSGGARKGSLVTIRARPKNGTGPTSAVKVGFDENAAEGLDRLDEPAPPGRFSGLSLRLKLPGDAHPRRRSLMTERRPPTDGSEEGHTFDLRLQATTGGPIQVTSDGLSAIGNDEAKLLRPSTGRSYDLAEGEPVTIEDADSTGLKLAIGSGSYVEEQAQQVMPDEVSLTSYPNPTRGQATVEYTLPEAKKVTLEVYDVLGRRVAVLEEGQKQAGRHTATLSERGLSSGVYFGQLKAGDQTLTQKITVVR